MVNSQGMPAEITVSKEDYLKAILEAESEGHIVIPALLAQWLKVSAPAVTKAVKRLRKDGYIDANREGALKLTTRGREIANRTALRHHLVERMLAEIFGMEWHQIHAEAERLEHAISPAFEARLIKKLGKRGDCPHGNTILPETPVQMRRRGLVPLGDATLGMEYVIASLYERDAKLLEFLHKLGLGPKIGVKLVEQNYDDTIRVLTPRGPVTLGRTAADRIWVRPKPEREPKKRSR